MSIEKVLYTAQATATGGRDGHARSSDGVLDVGLAMPASLGGSGAAGTNPEQLFAAGYAACFLSAVRLVAGQRKVTIDDGASVTAEVDIGPKSGGFGLGVRLKVQLPGLDPSTAEAIVETAHQVCPYSNATRGNIDVGLVVG